MSTLRLSLRWASPTMIACLALVTACSSSPESSASAAGSANGGSTSASAGSSGASVAGAGANTAGGASGSSTQGGSSGSTAQAGAPAGTTGGGAGTTGGGASGGGASGSAGTSAAAGASNGGSNGSGGSSTSSLTLTSPGWTAMSGCTPDNRTACPVFPKENIGTNLGGSNKSPELDWTAGPSGTQGYAIVMQDLTNISQGKPLVHWVMWNIPGATRMLPAGLETTAMPSVPAGSSQRSFNGNGYQGSGKCGNLYEFTLYALPTATFTPSAATTTAVRDDLAATNAPSATLRAKSGAPGCTE
ncbi:MAG TPA: hypothetical protein VER04_26475 [Polyangiaceae bacterium]|nr:hypothetical protein [Polyangiaceae bacterium]